MKEYVTESESYHEVKLRLLLAILNTLGIQVKDEGYETNVYKDEKLVASFSISL